MILVTGATGFVGQKILQMRSDALPCPSLRGASEEDVKRILGQYELDAIIHTAAISDISACQADPEDAWHANVQIPVYLAKAAKHAKLICFSSDQVYGGMESEGPYTEDAAKPGNLYAEYKLLMEQRVLDIAPESVMLRAEWMYDYCWKKPNFLMNILKAQDSISFSSRQFRGITYVKEVVQNMDSVLRLPGGVYNFGSETSQSMYTIAKDFLALIGKNIPLLDAPPRHNLWMNCEKASMLGVTFQSVEDALKTCANDYQLA